MLMVRIDATADDSLAVMRERRILGTAIAAMIKYNRDHDQQFDERKSLFPSASASP